MVESQFRNQAELEQDAAIDAVYLKRMEDGDKQEREFMKQKTQNMIQNKQYIQSQIKD